MSGRNPYMPLYVGDFLADTADLDAEKTGAYLLLIMHYWQHGGLPDNPAALARIAKVTAYRWKKLSPVLQKYFRAGWRHKRIDHELERADAIREKRSRAGVIGNAERWQVRRGTIAKRSHPYKKDLTTTETVPREAKRPAEPASQPTLELAETVRRRGWKP